jgi:hypothetical protein
MAATRPILNHKVAVKRGTRLKARASRIVASVPRKKQHLLLQIPDFSCRGDPINSTTPTQSDEVYLQQVKFTNMQMNRCIIVTLPVKKKLVISQTIDQSTASKLSSDLEGPA